MATPPNWTNVRVDRSAVEALIGACQQAVQAYEDGRTKTVAAVLDGSEEWRGGKADTLLADIGRSFDHVRREINALEAAAEQANSTLVALEREQAWREADRQRYHREVEAERLAAERAVAEQRAAEQRAADEAKAREEAPRTGSNPAPNGPAPHTPQRAPEPEPVPEPVPVGAF
jgi:hypothetical protein